jgi:hypothetical protein
MNIALLFLRSNWKFILGGILVAVVVWRVNVYLDDIYNSGKLAGITEQAKKDQELLNDIQSKYDEKVAWIEKHSTVLANEYAETNRANAIKFQELNKRLNERAVQLDKLLYTYDGKPIKPIPTNGLPTSESYNPLDVPDIHLGPEFSDLWNQYNRELIK